MESITADALWQAYLHGDASARQALIEHYLPLVKRVCGRMSFALPGYIDLGDLEGAAVFGLIEAINNFCPQKGVKFETYAVARIRGAVFDSLRRLDFAPRSVRQKAKRIQDATQRLHARLGRFAAEAELAAELGISVKELDKWLQEVQAIGVLSLNTPLDSDDDDGGGDMMSLLAASDEHDPIEQILAEERLAELATAIDNLSHREQLLLSLYYDEDLTLREVGQVLGISESRASQIHTAVILKLRARLQN